METNKTNKNNYVKRFALDIIKVLFGLLLFSTLFHSQISSIIDSFSDFGFHHYFLTTFLALIFLVITIEFEFFNGDHWYKIKEQITQIINKNKKSTN